jgi:mono/diheme cytochrome c family protein
MNKNILTILLPFSFISWFSFQDKEFEESIARGKELYEELCITCHLGNGKGTPGQVPPLAGADYILKNPVNAIYAQKFGLDKPIVVNGVKYTTPMAPANISDEEIADITNYILNSWGNKSKMVTVKQVAAVKK